MDADAVELTTKRFIAEFFQVILTDKRFPCALPDGVTIEHYAFFVEEIHGILLSPQNDLTDHRLTTTYREKLHLLRPSDFFSDVAISVLKTSWLDRFLTLEPLSWSSVGAVLFIAVNFTIKFIEYSGETEFVSCVINYLAAYFKAKWINSVNGLGGWDKFGESLLKRDDAGVDILPYVDKYTSVYLEEDVPVNPALEEPESNRNCICC